MRTHQKFSMLVLFVLTLAGISGCSGEKVVPVTGKVVLPDDITLGKEDGVAIVFHPSPPNEKIPSVSGRVTGSDPKFTLVAGKQKGVVPGTYKVTASVQIYQSGGGPGDKEGPVGEFNKTYGSPNNSKLSVTIPSEPTSVTLDFKAGTATAEKSGK